MPTPRGGGIGIVLSFLTVGIVCTKAYAFLAICAAAAWVGLLSDMSDISSGIRLVLHLALSSAMSLLAVNAIQLPGSAAVVVFFILSMIFLTGSANIYNFMDGINGIAAITAITAFGLLAVFAAYNGYRDSPLVALAVCITFSSAGFLYFNMPKAKIFLGDVGALFLGFAFAGMTILLSKSIPDFICMASFLFTFYADEVITMYIRIKDGQSLFIPHRRHFYQILANEAGVPHWKISCSYAAAQLFIGVSVLFMRPLGVWAVAGALSFYFIAFVVMNILVRRKLRV
ncbi:MAG: UDP-N-acetylmuramyl pentapeptide phosphotransferase [Candidatus Omnitrophica bacterium]|nr:UDP-N-acetylmuramyl pentapeptide phosphotransferase [Candidatus Omnitrophota bacterium]